MANHWRLKKCWCPWSKLLSLQFLLQTMLDPSFSQKGRPISKVASTMSKGSCLACQVKPLKAEEGAARNLLSLGNNECVAVN